jgi:hypothetical protein
VIIVDVQDVHQNDIKEWNKIKNLNYDEQHKLFSDYCPKDSDKKDL